MFGPQARAAELQAVRSAAMRQRTHEVEERIPTPAAVSLTDFARYQPISRNKGNKQYRPLMLEDIDSLSQIDPTSSPDQDPALTQDFSTPNPPRQAPIAPKAMLTGSSVPSSSNRSVKIPPVQVPVPCDYDGSPAWAPTQLQPASVQPHSSLPKPPRSAEFIFGLNGYSPAKSELQFQQMKFSRPQPERMGLEGDHRQEETYHYMVRDQYPHPEYSCHHAETTLPSQQRLELFNVLSDPFAIEHPYLRPHFERTSTFANDILHHENTLQQFRTGAQHYDLTYDRSSKMQTFVAAQQAMAKTGKTVLHNPQLLTTTKTREGDDPSRIRGLDRTGSYNIGTLVDGGCPGTVDIIHRRASASTTRSGQHRDPFSSGFTPQLRNAEPVEDWISGDEESPSAICLSIRPRQPEECQAICRAIQKRDAQTPTPGLELTPGHVRPATPVTELHLTDQHDVVSFPVDGCTGSETWCTLQQLYETDREKIRGVLVALSQDLEHATHRVDTAGTSSFTEQGLHTAGHSPVDRSATKVGSGQQGHELDSKIVAKAPSPTTIRTVREATTSRDLQTEKTDINQEGHEQPTEMQEHLKDPVGAARMPLANNFLLKGGQSVTSPPARLARDPRYRPLSAQTVALHGSLQLW